MMAQQDPREEPPRKTQNSPAADPILLQNVEHWATMKKPLAQPPPPQQGAIWAETVAVSPLRKRQVARMSVSGYSASHEDHASERKRTQIFFNLMEQVLSGYYPWP